MRPRITATAEQIARAQTPSGGWTKATLAGWGVSWPPPKGWRANLIKQSKSKGAA